MHQIFDMESNHNAEITLPILFLGTVITDFMA